VALVIGRDFFLHAQVGLLEQDCALLRDFPDNSHG